MGVVGLRERKKLEVRERLCVEAAALFGREDAASISIDRIAEGANVSRATFFNYFPSKGALLDELARRMTEQLHRYLGRLAEAGGPLDASLAEWFTRSVATIRRTETLSRVLFGRAFAGADESELRAAQMADVHHAYATLVRAAQVRGELADDADVEFFAEMIAGAMTTLLNNWFNDPAYPLEARAAQTARFLAAAIAAGSGRSAVGASPTATNPSQPPASLHRAPHRKAVRHVTRTR